MISWNSTTDWETWVWRPTPNSSAAFRDSLSRALLHMSTVLGPRRHLILPSAEPSYSLMKALDSSRPLNPGASSQVSPSKLV